MKANKKHPFPSVPCSKCRTMIHIWTWREGDSIPKDGDYICQNCYDVEEGYYDLEEDCSICGKKDLTFWIYEKGEDGDLVYCPDCYYEAFPEEVWAEQVATAGDTRRGAGSNPARSTRKNNETTYGL